jgi:hypothetical protein
MSREVKIITEARASRETIYCSMCLLPEPEEAVIVQTKRLVVDKRLFMPLYYPCRSYLDRLNDTEFWKLFDLPDTANESRESTPLAFVDPSPCRA